MRSILALALPWALVAQTCTGFCQQQVSCPNGESTTISGVVYAPNGTDPLPGVVVYIPNGSVPAFTPGVSCASAQQLPTSAALLGTTTGVDGKFTLANVPVGTNIPLVIQSGRWRRQLVVPATTACTDTSFPARFAQTQSEGDIPRFAVVTGSADAVECVLRKVGIADSEFTNPNGNGRIQIYLGTGSPGAQIDPSTPSADALMANQTTLNSYDVLMLPCEGANLSKPPGQLSNLVQFANAGGRVYASHYSFDWMYLNPPFDTVVQWDPDQLDPPDGTATVDTSFAQGQTLSQWLGVVGASTAPGQIAISTVRHDLDKVIAPTQSWLTLNNPAYGNPVMQFTFDTPVGTTSATCGRVLFNEYHVENQVGNTSRTPFPNECASGPMTPQEKLLEFSLFDLTGNGTPPTLAPAKTDFGSEAVGLSSGVQKFSFTNNTMFPAAVTGVTSTGDFTVTTNTCSTVSVGGTCEIAVIFTPTALGARTGTLSVTANTGTVTAALSGTGITPLALSATSLDFGSVDVGATVSKTLTLTNQTSVPQTLATPATLGSFTVNSTCTGSLPAQGSCTLTIVFAPTTTGSQTGSISYGVLAASGSSAPLVSANLTGNGIDFAEAVGPASGQVVAGITSTTTSTTSPIAGFANPITVTCSTTAPASTCALASDSFTPNSSVADKVTITTTSKYAVIGFSGFDPGWLLTLLAPGTGLLLLRKRRVSSKLARLCGWTLCVVAISSALTGCSGKQPAQNNPYTPPGTYSYTVTATDGFLTHSATYSLVVAAQ